MHTVKSYTLHISHGFSKQNGVNLIAQHIFVLLAVYMSQQIFHKYALNIPSSFIDKI
uniref:Uncharacterized protein n=1 Tax=Arundo donax TaxID=35708 RepID=A0A0A9CF45_ARUDO